MFVYRRVTRFLVNTTKLHSHRVGVHAADHPRPDDNEVLRGRRRLHTGCAPRKWPLKKDNWCYKPLEVKWSYTTLEIEHSYLKMAIFKRRYMFQHFGFSMLNFGGVKSSSTL